MKDAKLSEAMGTRAMVREELRRYRGMRERVLAPESGRSRNTLIMVLLLAVSTAIVYTWYEALLLWVIVTFLLYSFNYIVFFLPITRHPVELRRGRPRSAGRPIAAPLRYILRERRRFMVEVLATMFLVGLVPLARSFFVLFGVGLVFTVYHGAMLGELPVHLTAGLVVQILVIMGYFVLVVMISPQTQGFTDIARNIRSRIRTARTRSMSAYIRSVSLAGLLAAAVSLMAIGAILLPGRTIDSLIVFLHGGSIAHILVSAAILVAEFFIMRVLQSRGSRTMAVALIDDKLDALRSGCADPLDDLIAEAGGASEVDGDRYEDVLNTFYPIAIYEVVETNILGRLPVYLVVPDVDLLFDLEALEHIGARRGDRGRPLPGEKGPGRRT